MKLVFRESWLTKKRYPYFLEKTVALSAFLLLFCGMFFRNILGSTEWATATYHLAIEQGEAWRLFTTLFAHSDAGHLLSNFVLFAFFSYWLFAYFSSWFFPFLGILMGGLTNFLVLHTLPTHTILLGISGVVYWMGAAWITLFLLLERQVKWRRRWGYAIFLTLMLFVPDTIQANISYLSHGLGFFFGALCASLYYLWKRQEFKQAERWELQPDADPWNLEQEYLGEEKTQL